MSEHQRVETGTTSTSHGFSRRSLVKAGAHAAWAVPVVTVVTSAPAFAATSDQAALSVATVTASRADRVVTVTAQVSNTGAAATTGLQVRVSLNPHGAGASWFESTSMSNSGAFDDGTSTSTSGSGLARFVYTATGQLDPADGPVTLTVTVTVPPGTQSGGGDATVTAYAANAPAQNGPRVNFS
jgi:hypothetical protein